MCAASAGGYTAADAHGNTEATKHRMPLECRLCLVLKECRALRSMLCSMQALAVLYGLGAIQQHQLPTYRMSLLLGCASTTT
jgi:hypothetical protein